MKRIQKIFKLIFVKRITLLLLLLFLSPRFYALDEGFFNDLKEEKQIRTYSGSKLELESAPFDMQSLEESVFYEHIQEGVTQVSLIKLEQIKTKMLMMDQAVNLPPKIREKYRDEQKQLATYEKVVAGRYVENAISKTQIRAEDARTPEEYMTAQALPKHRHTAIDDQTCAS
jgi:hypothetical protein